MPTPRTLWAVLAGALACSGAQSTGPHGAGASIVVTPDSAAVPIGGTVTLTAAERDAAGHTVTSSGFFWSSSDTTIASVTQSGTVTARQAGAAKIAASANGVSGVATVVVVPQAVGAVIVAPSAATLRVNTTLQLTDTVKDAAGHVLTGRSVSWATDNASVATVDAAGLVVARAVGTAHISASSDGQTGTATITVTLLPVARITITPHDPSLSVQATVQLTAQPLDSAGDPLAGRPITWKSRATSVATVSASGVVTGVAPGAAVIEATAEGVTGGDTVTVKSVPIVSVTISPKSVTLQTGQQQQFTATIRDANGNVVTTVQPSWLSTNQSVVTVNNSGLATAAGVGQASVIVQAGGKADTALVTVNPVPVASVTVTPNPDTIAVGGSAALTATARDANGNVLTGRAATWTSSTPAVATVDGSGNVHGAAVGSATISATIGGVTGTALIVVVPGPPDHIVVTPAKSRVRAGDTQQLTAQVFDASNDPIPNATVTWISTNPSVATVDSTGLVTAVAAGTDTIVAQSGAAVGAAEVDVHGVLGGDGVASAAAEAKGANAVGSAAAAAARRTLGGRPALNGSVSSAGRPDRSVPRTTRDAAAAADRGAGRG